jgi:hypothetical protein
MWLVVLFSLTLGLVFLQEAPAGGGYRSVLNHIGCLLLVVALSMILRIPSRYG